eukprot:5495296-Amphidinium_carterae.1
MTVAALRQGKAECVPSHSRTVQPQPGQDERERSQFLECIADRWRHMMRCREWIKSGCRTTSQGQARASALSRASTTGSGTLVAS